MKKLVINIGLENVIITKVDVKGKAIKVIESVSIHSSKFYNNTGNIMIKKIIDAAGNKFPKDIHTLDVDIVLPNYLSSYGFWRGSKDDIEKFHETYAGKLNDRIEFISGEYDGEKIHQVIYYNKNVINNMIKELYKEKINLNSIVTSISAYQRTLPFYFDSDEMDGSINTVLFVDVGLDTTKFIIFEGDNPIYYSESTYNLYDIFKRAKKNYDELTFGQFLNIFSNTNPYSDYSQEKQIINISEQYEDIQKANAQELEQMFRDAFDESNYENMGNNADDSSEESDTNADSSNLSNLDKAIRNEIYAEISTLLDNVMCTDIHDVGDYIAGEYGIQKIKVVSNSKTAMKFIRSQLSNVYDIFDKPELDRQYEISDIRIDLSDLYKKDVALVGGLGGLICNMAKSKGGK